MNQDTIQTTETTAQTEPKVRVQRGVKCVCGSSLFLRKYPTRGTWNVLVEYSDDGKFEVVDTDVDSVRNTAEPKFMRCASCGKRLNNPEALNPDLSQVAKETITQNERK